MRTVSNETNYEVNRNSRKKAVLKNPLQRVLKAFISLRQFIETPSVQRSVLKEKLLTIIGSLQAYYAEHTVHWLC